MASTFSSEEEKVDAMFSNKRVVRIQNDLQGNISSLTAHCKSLKDDVGEHELTAGEYFEWDFKEKMIWKTTYRCNLRWNQTVKDIDAYTTARDKKRCKLQCWWSIRTNGGYAFNKKKKEYEPLYPWNN